METAVAAQAQVAAHDDIAIATDLRIRSNTNGPDYQPTVFYEDIIRCHSSFNK